MEFKLKNDIKVAISTAPHRFTKVWRQREVTWSQMVERLSKTARTGETVAEYHHFSKPEKDARKDVGGFVGGRLKDGRRLKSNVLYRQLLTLDADSGTRDFPDALPAKLGHGAWCFYSTHSHTADAPRLRIIIPLKRKVTPDEYQAVARKAAEKIGMQAMDPTTFEPERLMHFPSTPSNGTYIFKYNDGPILDPDKVLALYDNWKDTSSWPLHPKEVSIRKTAAKAEDPTTKQGLIGAFCRAYTIQDVITNFLPDVYSPTTDENRWTYNKGTTFGGLVIFDDGKFGLSFHSTDPAGGEEHNAFDFLRIHKYRQLDLNVKPDTPFNRLPSYLAMMDFAKADKATMREYNREQTAELKQMFKEAGEDGEEADTSWTDDLKMEGKGNSLHIAQSVDNLKLILTHDPLLKDHFGLDLFSHKYLLKKDVPWRKVDGAPIWSDTDDACLRNYLSKHYKIDRKALVDDVLTEVMLDNRFHPVRDYLESLTWDGVERVPTLLVDYLGAKDSDFTRAVTKTFLKAAVARVYIPGCKFDQCLVLSGPQGIGKSTLLKILGGEWFNDSITSFSGKDPMEQLMGTWIDELSEMQATNKADNDQIKAFLSRPSDKFRLAYGRRTQEYPRQCVFSATTNDTIFLKDRTGGRRFWPVLCGIGSGGEYMPDNVVETTVAKMEALKKNRDLIWAEVFAYWRVESQEALLKFLEKRNINPATYPPKKQEEMIRRFDRDLSCHSLLLPPEAAQEARRLQSLLTEGSEKAGIVEDFLSKKLPTDWANRDVFNRREYLAKYDERPKDQIEKEREYVCTLEIWCEAFEKDKSSFTNKDSRELSAILINILGWKLGPTHRFGPYGIQRSFTRR